MTRDSSNLVWIDLEMTGLEPRTDFIIEIATIVTNASLDIVAEGPVLAIHQSDDVLQRMDAWNTEQHGKSGLTQRVRESTCSVAEAERLTLEFVARHVPENTSPMCGNSVCQDRRFLHHHMARLESYFHYRHVDVSTLKELCRRWAPHVMEEFTKEPSHRALDDIRESIAELEFYRRRFLRT